MKIGIIGAGNMGSALAKRISGAGHDVAITAKDMAEAEKVAQDVGGTVHAVPQEHVADGADIVIAATPAASQADALRGAGDLAGKIVIDIANPIKPDLSGLTVGHTASFVEDLARELPGVKLVKAFNTTSSQVVADNPDFGGKRASVFYASNDEDAKNAVRELVESMGFEALDSGPLQNARYLEPMGMLNIWFMAVANWGPAIAPTWLRRS